MGTSRETKSTDAASTLGDMLKGSEPIGLLKIGLAFIVATVIGVFAWSLLLQPIAGILAFGICGLTFGIMLFKNRQTTHFLIHADQMGFMSGLNLTDKTAIFDGSNIYHFGLDHSAGPRVLEGLVGQLRADGHRIICFFDATIYFTLRDNGEFMRGAPFSPQLLCTAFGLNANEIYVVPSKIQADQFIIETLSHLPKSFAVTNDLFRDYAGEYDFLTRGDNWRKGVSVKHGELLLAKQRLKNALLL